MLRHIKPKWGPGSEVFAEFLIVPVDGSMGGNCIEVQQQPSAWLQFRQFDGLLVPADAIELEPFVGFPVGR
jgi:hypothetical protein